MSNDILLKSFPGLVKDYFGRLAHEHGLHVHIASYEGNRVFLSGNLFTLDISIATHPGEFGNPSFVIRKPGMEAFPGYHLSTIMEMRDPDYTKRKRQEATSHERGLALWMAESVSDLKQWCRDILAGNFSWVPAYKEFMDEERKLSQYVSKLPMDHPVHKMYWDGYPDWKAIVRNHIAQEMEAKKDTDSGSGSILIS